MKKILIMALFLCLLGIVALGTVVANAETVYYDVTGGQITFDTSTGTVTGFVGSPTEVTIPSKINGVNVISIGYRAFYNCSSLTSVTIPNNVTSIGEYAFDSCIKLAIINIPDSIKSIGKRAFYNCSSIKSLTIPNSVTSIGEWAFNGTHWLNNYPNDFVIVGNNILIKYKGNSTSITIPNGVTSIGYYAFYNCSSLTSVTIPNSVTSIGYYAFDSCINLTRVFFYGNAPLVGSLAVFNFTPSKIYYLEGATGFTTPTWQGKTTEVFEPINVSGGQLNFNKGTGTIEGYAGSPIEITIPSSFGGLSVTSIANNSFYGCSTLTSITIPNTITSIGEGALKNCNNLTSAYFYGNRPNMAYNAFENASSNFKIYYVEGTTGFPTPSWWGYTNELFTEVPNLGMINSNYPSGTYEGSININLSAIGQGYEIYYTLDGSNPQTNGIKYTAPIPIQQTTTVKAVSLKESVYSQVYEYNYTISLPPLLYSINEISFTNLSGQTIQSPKTGDYVIAKVNVTKNENSTSKDTLIISLYDSK